MEQKPLKGAGFFRHPEDIPELKGIKEHGGNLYEYIDYLIDQRLLLAIAAIDRGYSSMSWRWISVGALFIGMSLGISLSNWAHKYDAKHPVTQEAK